MTRLRRRYGRSTGPKGALRVRGVLAGAYRGKDVSDRLLLTHAMYDEEMKTLCRRIGEENMSDPYGARPAGELPSCPLCLERLQKLTAREIKAGRPAPVLAGPAR